MPTQAPPGQSPFNAWLDDFFSAYYRRRPVNATFIGVHPYDHTLPDYSPTGVDETLAEMQGLLNRLHSLPDEPLSPAERIDRRLAEGFLQIQLWEFQSEHFQRANPSTYTGEAIFGLIALFLSDFAPLAERLEAAIERMQAIPAFLRQAQANLQAAPQAWSERAIRECRGALAFLDEGIERLAQAHAIQDPAFRRAAAQAAAAFGRFQAFLESGQQARPTQAYACGEQAFDLLLRQGHFVESSAQDIAAYAEEELRLAQAYLQSHAADFGAASPEEALGGLADLHPSLPEYPQRYGDLWQACRQTSQEQDLLTWPDFPIRYMPQPAWARKAAPFLYFLFYRAPAAFNRPAVHNYLYTPIEAGLPPSEQESLLRLNNDSVIKMNHVIHHGGIGHHVQNWHAYHAQSRIGQVAAVDCAARIAMFCGGTMAEGWAVYTTDLMCDTGFVTPLEKYAEYQTRRRMCARAVVDVRLHVPGTRRARAGQGSYTLEEARRYYQEQAGMSPAAALGEAVKNSMFPGAAVMYVLGSDRIHTLRKELSARLGGRFSLRQFHDQFLSYGSIPVSLAAAEMEKESLHAER
jgi:uncharacterized protein (DUF885 family)